jgi:SAM-dependent methyltransferase
VANNQRTIVRRLLPTSHKVLLDRLIQPAMDAMRGDVLVIGAGKENYQNRLPFSCSVISTDIESGPYVDCIADAHDLPFETGRFDSLVAIDVLEHLKDPSEARSEMARVLRPGGQVLLTIPFAFRIHGDPFDFQRLTARGLEELFQGPFECEIRPFGNRLHVISDIITTASKPMAALRFLNHAFCMSFLSEASLDCPSGYIVRLIKRAP